ncbi:MAG: NAD(P)/FAD-dependent oxidoreductase [Gemmatimonadetes bacterium]|nr:NAD(P)/FAD-dependent oxidoreductase [Gemmatimonadota bacterium]
MHDAVIIGGGPGGLAVSRALSVRGVDHVVLERGDRPGHSWANVYDSLHLHTGKHLSALPGRPLPRSAPLFVPAPGFLAYLRAYATDFGLPVRLRCEATRAVRDGDRWIVESTTKTAEARALVIATGIMSSPAVPEIGGREAFRGTVIHSVEYRRPGRFAWRRVLVVGAGNSAGEIAPELADAGASVTVSIRSGANVVPRTVLGVPIQYVAWAALKLPGPVRAPVVAAFARIIRSIRGAPPFPRARGPLLGQVPMIGYKLVDAIRAGRVQLRGGLDRFTPTGARFQGGLEEEFDDVILATGFRAALGPVEGLVTRDERGFACRRARVVSTEQPDLYFVGHHYDSAGGLHNISRDAPAVARLIAAKRA